eukprot:g61611.t1
MKWLGPEHTQSDLQKFDFNTLAPLGGPADWHQSRVAFYHMVIVPEMSVVLSKDNAPRNQIPRLEAVPEATPLCVVRRGAQAGSPSVLKAPRDIDGNISSSNIVSGARNRRRTPANVSTHVAVDRGGGGDEVVMTDADDEIRYIDVCLFTRVLRKPEKVLRQMPDVVQARTKEVEVLYDVGCLEWATWNDAERDKIKPIRTGFVDAIKVDEAAGTSKYKSRLVTYGNQMVPFQHFNPHKINRTEFGSRAKMAPSFGVSADFCQRNKRGEEHVNLVQLLHMRDFALRIKGTLRTVGLRMQSRQKRHVLIKNRSQLTRLQRRNNGS